MMRELQNVIEWSDSILGGAFVSAPMPVDGFARLSAARWRAGGNTPANALLMQAGLALLLVLLGAWAHGGFVTMVEYTAPVFWFFLLLAGLSLFVLRTQQRGRPRSFRVPLYPLTPLIFRITCVYMLHSSLAYTGPGAVVGVGELLAGVPLLFLARRHYR
jgi:APA family basic amino acid/polyamine antiporter